MSEKMFEPPTSDELWAAQLACYPDSVRLTSQDIAAWVFDKSLSVERQMVRAYHATLALAHPEVVWYRTHRAGTPASTTRPEGGWMGFRFGVEGYEHLSGFTHL